MTTPEHPAIREKAAAGTVHATRAAAKADISLLRHMAAVLATDATEGREIIVKMVGGQLTRGKFDTVFTDGLSLVVGNHREYFPLTGITKIVVHPPRAARREEK